MEILELIIEALGCLVLLTILFGGALYCELLAIHLHYERKIREYAKKKD